MWRFSQCCAINLYSGFIFGVFFIPGIFSTLTSTFTTAITVDKVFAVNSCSRTYTDGERDLSTQLKSLLLSNQPICNTSTSTTTTTIEKKKRKRREILYDLMRELAKSEMPKRRLRRDGYTLPTNLPSGTVFSYCNSSGCCTPKKTLQPTANIYYNLCRECVHLISLPSGYTPRDHYHVTCQDADYTSTCLMGEGGCTTNMVTKTVAVDAGGNITISVGNSCSCEILYNSIFANFIV